MSWALRRKILYIIGVVLFFALLFGVPLFYWYNSIPSSCTNGKQDQGETSPDLGGPCRFSDPSTLAPSSVLWARAFKVRDGEYSAAGYIQNPNDDAGVGKISYQFKLYDSENVLVAERAGSTYVMPGGVTPVFENNISAGNRIVTHTFLTTQKDWRWEHLRDASKAIVVSDRKISDVMTNPRISAEARNSSVKNILNISFIAVAFDTAGNALAASASKIDRLDAGQSTSLVFTWPVPFAEPVGRVDILPILPPVPAWTAK